MRATWIVAGGVAALAGMWAAVPDASAQSERGLCQAGLAVEYVNAGRRYPGRVEGDNGRNCLVYAKAYMGVIDVAYADLRADSGATDKGKPDVAAGETALNASPREIVDAFERDPDGAKARFLNRLVRVKGSIFTLRSDQIWMKANLYQTAAVCMVEPADRSAIQSLREGQEISVEGTASDRGNKSIFLQGCRVVAQGAAQPASVAAARPPAGRYFCRSAGQGIGYLSLAAGSYSVDGVTGNWRYDPATRRLSFPSGSYANWGWTGEWRTDPDGVGGPPEPRIVLTGKGTRVTCTPQA